MAALLISAPAHSSDYPRAVKVLIAEAGKYYDEAKYASAKAQFNQAIELEPNCPDAYNGLGLCAMKEGNLTESNGCYLTAIKLKPDYYNALFNLANNYYVEQNFADAISCYSRALEAAEKNGKKADADLLNALANVYRDRSLKLSGLNRQKDEDMALKLYKTAIELNRKHPQSHANLGKLYLYKHQNAEAEQELRTAISLRPNYAYAYFVLGQIYVQKKEYPAALVAFHSSLKYETVDSYKDETTKAMMKLDIPASIVEHFALGFEKLNSGAWDAAQIEFEAAAAAPTALKAVALNNLGYANACGGNLAAAIDCYKRALALSPHGLPELYYNLGTAFFQCKRLAEAEDAFRKCLTEAKGNHFLAHNALGIVLKTKGELSEALTQYSLALMQSGGSLSVVEFNRGIVQEKLGQKAEAAASYAKYLQASPSGLNAAAARERLAHLR